MDRQRLIPKVIQSRIHKGVGMRFTSLLLVLWSISGCCTTAEIANASGRYPHKVCGRGFSGTIMDTIPEGPWDYVGYRRMVPSTDEVRIAESILGDSLDHLIGYLPSQMSGCPDILHELEDYHRQYFGFLDSLGQPILYIQFVHMDYYDEDSWDKVGIAMDACSTFWSIWINIHERRLAGFRSSGPLTYPMPGDQ